MYKGRLFNRESAYVCGTYLSGDIYPVFQPAGKRRKKCRPTKEIQKRLNQRNAEKKLTRLVHANFTEKDMALHLTYRPECAPADEAAAKKELQRFIRKLKRLYGKRGLELKYISCTEYGGRRGRVHHHMIISGGADRDAVEALWGNGYANSKRLQFEEDGVAGLAHYVAKKSVGIYRRWNSSRNLVRPEPIQKDGRLSMADVEQAVDAIESGNARAWFERMYPGYVLVEAEWSVNGINRGTYIRFEMRRKPGADISPLPGLPS